MNLPLFCATSHAGLRENGHGREEGRLQYDQHHTMIFHARKLLSSTKNQCPPPAFTPPLQIVQILYILATLYKAEERRGGGITEAMKTLPTSMKAETQCLKGFTRVYKGWPKARDSG
eukprot:1150286-Pelagomonas_calceolata.AAC.14